MLFWWMRWLILAGLLFIGEIVTTGFILFWFGIAALLCAILDFAHVHIYFQIITFIVAAVVLIIFTRPLTKGLLKPKGVQSNVFAIIGKIGTVVKEIDNIQGEGQVKIGGEVWRAESEDGSNIQKGTDVEVIKVEGVRVIVKIKSESEVK